MHRFYPYASQRFAALLCRPAFECDRNWGVTFRRRAFQMHIVNDPFAFVKWKSRQVCANTWTTNRALPGENVFRHSSWRERACPPSLRWMGPSARRVLRVLVHYICSRAVYHRTLNGCMLNLQQLVSSATPAQSIAWDACIYLLQVVWMAERHFTRPRDVVWKLYILLFWIIYTYIKSMWYNKWTHFFLYCMRVRFDYMLKKIL